MSATTKIQPTIDPHDMAETLVQALEALDIECETGCDPDGVPYAIQTDNNLTPKQDRLVRATARQHGVRVSFGPLDSLVLTFREVSRG